MKSEPPSGSFGGRYLRPRCSYATFVARRPWRVRRDERLLEQIGFDHVLQRVPLLAHGGGNGVDTDRAAFVDVDQRLEKDTVLVVETFFIDAGQFERRLGDGDITFPSPSTAAKSRTRRSNRFAMRGVPRLRLDSSQRALSSAVSLRRRALALRISCNASGA